MGNKQCECSPLRNHANFCHHDEAGVVEKEIFEVKDKEAIKDIMVKVGWAIISIKARDTGCKGSNSIIGAK